MQLFSAKATKIKCCWQIPYSSTPHQFISVDSLIVYKKSKESSLNCVAIFSGHFIFITRNVIDCDVYYYYRKKKKLYNFVTMLQTQNHQVLKFYQCLLWCMFCLWILVFIKCSYKGSSITWNLDKLCFQSSGIIFKNCYSNSQQ